MSNISLISNITSIQTGASGLSGQIGQTGGQEDSFGSVFMTAMDSAGAGSTGQASSGNFAAMEYIKTDSNVPGGESGIADLSSPNSLFNSILNDLEKILSAMNGQNAGDANGNSSETLTEMVTEKTSSSLDAQSAGSAQNANNPFILAQIVDSVIFGDNTPSAGNQASGATPTVSPTIPPVSA